MSKIEIDGNGRYVPPMPPGCLCDTCRADRQAQVLTARSARRALEAREASDDGVVDATHGSDCRCESCLPTRRDEEVQRDEAVEVWASNEPPLDALYRIRAAISGDGHGDAHKLATIGIDVIDMLLRKNHDYGCSAWRAPVLAPGMTPRQAIQCRMSDKISRLNTLLSGDAAQVTESIEDTMKDLAGYAILWLGAPQNSEE